MNEFFQNRLDNAHAMIDDRRYDEAVELLKNLDTRIHDTGIRTNIEMTSNEIENKYKSNLTNLISKANDPEEGYLSKMGLKKWRSQEYLRFYDQLLKKHDL